MLITWSWWQAWRRYHVIVNFDNSFLNGVYEWCIQTTLKHLNQATSTWFCSGRSPGIKKLKIIFPTASTGNSSWKGRRGGVYFTNTSYKNRQSVIDEGLGTILTDHKCRCNYSNANPSGGPVLWRTSTVMLENMNAFHLHILGPKSGSHLSFYHGRHVLDMRM